MGSDRQMDQIVSLDTGRVDDARSYIDEALSRGARAIQVLVIWDEPDEHDGEWRGDWFGESSPAERNLIYDMMKLIEISDGMHGADADE